MNLEKEPGEYTIKEIDDLYASGQLAKATYILLSVLGTPRMKFFSNVFKSF